MIYTYIALGFIGLYSIVSTGCYLEEKKAHRNTVSKARAKLSEQDEIIEYLAKENSRLSMVAKAYRTISVLNR